MKKNKTMLEPSLLMRKPSNLATPLWKAMVVGPPTATPAEDEVSVTVSRQGSSRVPSWGINLPCGEKTSTMGNLNPFLETECCLFPPVTIFLDLFLRAGYFFNALY